MKIGIQITARLKSSRLPFKLLKDLKGYSIIEHVINRSKIVKGVDNIVLCTSLNSQDKPLVDVSLENEIYYFLGSEEDVLQRMLDSALYFGFDYILSITGENPLFSIDHTNRIVDIIKQDQPDFTFFEGLPIGCSIAGVKTKALEVVCQVKKEVDTEIWGPLINQPTIFDIRSEKVSEFFFKPEWRFTNDYFEDYCFMQKIFSHFPDKSTPSLFSVLQLLQDHPEYLEIHKDRKQANVSPDVLERINTYYTENINDILKIKQNIYNDLR